MNIFNFKDLRFLIDFAHNPAGFNGIKGFLKHIDSPLKIGLVTGTGDRRDEDIRELGKISAEMFDHILLRQDRFLRGRTAEDILQLLQEGIASAGTNVPVEVLPVEVDSIKYAIRMAKPGSFIAILSEAVDNAIEIVQNYQEQERNGTLVV